MAQSKRFDEVFKKIDDTDRQIQNLMNHTAEIRNCVNSVINREQESVKVSK